MYLSLKHTRNLIQLRNRLCDVPDEQLNMSVFKTHQSGFLEREADIKSTCPTAACGVGWGSVFFADQLESPRSWTDVTDQLFLPRDPYEFRRVAWFYLFDAWWAHRDNSVEGLRERIKYFIEHLTGDNIEDVDFVDSSYSKIREELEPPLISLTIDQIENLIILHDKLEEVPEEKFDMRYYKKYEPGTRANWQDNCFTAACGIGWASIFLADRGDVSDQYSTCDLLGANLFSLCPVFTFLFSSRWEQIDNSIEGLRRRIRYLVENRALPNIDDPHWGDWDYFLAQVPYSRKRMKEYIR